jgi:flagellar M-ring protein FliF
VKTFWQGLGRSARIGLVTGIVVIAVATIVLALWLLRTERDVLFGNLSAQDAATMTAELDRMKVPYELAADGTTILVDRKQLHQTRLKLMSRDMPLHGAVGFELFNNTDFGMTEFAQKVNYQRALQGEITRTILALAEVESARVHLAFPEEGLFKRDQGKAKAAVTLALKQGQSLHPEQVKGIQRLVAAAVAGVTPQDVTIVDKSGIALTRATPASADGGADAGPQLELKREIERHLAQKASQVLDRAFGPGSALASVDAVLDMNQVRTTTENVIAPPVQPGEAVTGVIVRERETTRDEPLLSAARDAAKSGSSSQRETEYQVGRRVEQVVSQPGSIRRLQVLAVIKAPMDADQVERTRALVAAAVGASPERGDVVVVQPLGGLNGIRPRDVDLPPGPAPAEPTQALPDVTTTSSTVGAPVVVIALAALAGLVAAVLLVLLLVRRSGSRLQSRLGDAERRAAYEQVRRWLGPDAGLAADRTGGPQ